MLPTTPNCKDLATSKPKASLLQWGGQRPVQAPTKKIGVMLILSLGLLGLGFACDRLTKLEGIPAILAFPVQTSIALHERVPAALGVVRMLRNGAPLDPSVAYDRRVVSALHETQLFSYMIYPDHGQPALLDGQKYVAVRLSVSETVDRHAGGNAFKGFVIGASMFLLTPVLPLEYGYASQMTLELQRWDGETKHYFAASEGTASYQLFGATPLLTEELKGQVTERCLNSLMAQLVSDAGFYSARAAPFLTRPSGSSHSEGVSPGTP